MLNKQLLMHYEIIKSDVSVTLGPHNVSAMHPSSLIWTWCTQTFTQPFNDALLTSAWMSVSCYFYDAHLRLPLLHFLACCHLVSDLWLCQLFSMVTTGDSTMSNAGTHCQHFHLTVVIYPLGPGPIVSAALSWSLWLPPQTLNLNLSAVGVDIDTLSPTTVTSASLTPSSQQYSQTNDVANGGTQRSTGSESDSATEDETKLDLKHMNQWINEVYTQKLKPDLQRLYVIAIVSIGYKLMLAYLSAQRLSQVQSIRAIKSMHGPPIFL